MSRIHTVGVFALALAFVLVANTAAAGNLEANMKWGGWEKKMKKKVEMAKQKCAVEIPFEFDKASFDGAPKDSDPLKVCDSPYTALWNVCNTSPDAKKAVGEKVKKVHCAFAAGEPNIAMEGTTLSYKGPHGNSSKVKDFLMKNL